MKNKFLNTSLVFGLGFVFLRGISFLLLPVYTNFLSTYDAGIIFILYALLAFLNPFYALGMDAALFKFFNSSDYSQKQVISSSLLSVVVLSFCLSLLLFFYSSFFINFLDLDYNWVKIIAGILFFDSISSRLLILLRLFNLPRYFLSIGLINIVSSLLLNIIFIHNYKMGEEGAVYALLLTSVIQFIVLFPVLYKHLSIKQYNTALSKQMLRFGFPFLPAAILLILTSFVDRFFIEYFLGLEQVGLYGSGYKIGSVISVVVIAFNLSWQPYYLKSAKDLNFVSNIKLISEKFFIILLFLVVSVSLWSSPVVKIRFFNQPLIGESFWGSLEIVPWVCFGYFFYGLFILQMPPLYIKNKQNWSPVFWGVGTTVNIVCNYVLIPSLGILGAAVATLISFLIMFVYIKYKNQNWMPLNFINLSLIILFVLSVLVIIISKMQPSNYLLTCSLYGLYSFFSYKNLVKNKTINLL